jgi:hypothetical protein
MPTRASKPKKHEDAVQAARRVVDAIIEKTERTIDPAVSAAAAALSKLGASKGGEARAAKLSPKRRSQIAKKAAAARWNKPA